MLPRISPTDCFHPNVVARTLWLLQGTLQAIRKLKLEERGLGMGDMVSRLMPLRRKAPQKEEEEKKREFQRDSVI